MHYVGFLLSDPVRRFFFFFNDTATTEIYPLSLHDALPIFVGALILTAALLLASFAGAESLAPNELGRVMILEYHKIDYPEERWTRTPENFRRDLETLYARGYRLIALGEIGRAHV